MTSDTVQAGTNHVRWFEDLRSNNTNIVGGKNASLGEMISQLSARGIRVPDGFATTAQAYRVFIDHNNLHELIKDQIARYQGDSETLPKVGKRIRAAFIKGSFPEQTEESIRRAYQQLAQRLGNNHQPVAVRSSATAEDLPEASFAGQQDTFLNISGIDALLDAVRRCFASLFTDRAISYRADRGYDHLAVALSVGVQQMVHADAAGVMFTIDTETGFPRVVTIDAAWGLGETVVSGTVDPDTYTVFKPFLDRNDITPVLSSVVGSKRIKAVYAEASGHADEAIKTVDTSDEERTARVMPDEQVVKLARWGRDIEAHYGRPMDIEWARDGDSGEIYIVQARPETVQSRRTGALTTYSLEETGEELVRGLAVGDAIAAGTVRVLSDPSEAETFQNGDVLVASVTDPDWGPVMSRAAAVITEHGGRTAHAAIVSRELGIPAVIGAANATSTLKDGQQVTVSCAQGETGIVYAGTLKYTEQEISLEDVPKTRTRIMLSVASPAAAFRWHRLPVAGIGLARMEFIIMNTIRVHPMALIRYNTLKDEEAKDKIDQLTAGYDSKEDYFVDHLAQGIARIAASQHPNPVIVRTSDFKSNEYAKLIGGAAFESHEENPMLGVRGASRYTRDLYRDAFVLECRAIRRARERMGFGNIIVMIPFCRTLGEADEVVRVMADHGLQRGVGGLKVYVMAEIPSNIILADRFAMRFDGFSIGSNDLTQLTLGIDRGSEQLADIFDERDPAVADSIETLIERAHRAGVPVGICGQAPSDHPDFARFLVECNIDSISLNPDSVMSVIHHVSRAESRMNKPKRREQITASPRRGPNVRTP